MTILETIVEQKKHELSRFPNRLLAAGDLRDAMLERGERRDFSRPCATRAWAQSP